MKKTLFLLVCGLLILPSIISWAAQRVTREPNFFMPAGVWENRYTKAKIPPITQMRFRSETPPIVLEMRRQDAEAAQKLAEEKLKTQQEQQTTEKTTSKIAETTETSQKSDTLLPKPSSTNPVVLPQSPIKENIIVAKNTDNSTNTQAAVVDNTRPENSTVETQPVMLPPPSSPRITETKITQKHSISGPSKDSIAGFDQIFAEYQRDINNISNGKEFENPRLDNVLSQWNGQERSM